MEIVRHFHRRPGCHCGSPYILEDDYSPALQGRVSDEEWRVAFAELNHVVRSHGPNPTLWMFVSFISFIPLFVMIPIWTSNGQFNVFIWVYVVLAEFLLIVLLSALLIVRGRRFVARMESTVGSLNNRFHGRGVRFRFCAHHAHSFGYGYRRHLHHAEVVVTVEGVQVVHAGAYQQQLPPMYGMPAFAVNGGPAPVLVNGQPQYAPLPQQMPPPAYAAPEFQAPPPGYFENKPLLGNEGPK